MSPRSTLLALLLFIFSCALGTTLTRADEIVSARVIHGERVLIGDPVKVQIDVQHRAGDSYKLQLDERGLGLLELRGQPEITTRAIDGQSARTQVTITLVPFTTGKIPLPPFQLVRVSDSASLQTPALELNVEALSAPQERQIKDVRPLPAAPVNGWLRPVFFTVLLASAGLYLILRFTEGPLTRWALALVAMFVARREQQQAPVVPRQSLEDETIAKLRLLLASGLAAADIKRFHVQLSDIMINYAVKRYGRAGQEYTTEELFEMFETKGVPVLVSSAFEQILSACDMVKFARWQPDVEAAQRSVRQAIDLLKALNFNAQVKS